MIISCNYVCFLLVGESLKVKILKVYSLEDTVTMVGRIKECILCREQVSSSWTRQRSEVKKKKKTWHSGLQSGRWHALTEPSFPSHEVRQPGDVDTGGRGHGRRDGWWSGIDDMGRRSRQFREFDLFHWIIRKIDLMDGSILKRLASSILQSGEGPYHQFLGKKWKLNEVSQTQKQEENVCW